MDQSLDFSFHKGNPLSVTDELESPKPMPKPPALPLTDASTEHSNHQVAISVTDEHESSKPMPKPPALPLTDASAEHTNDQVAISEDDHLVEDRASPSMSDSTVEVLETLSILPAAAAAAKAPNAPFLSPVPNFSEQGATPPPPKPRPRAKVPLERGFTQMDWLKLTRMQPDLAGLKGRSSKRLIRMDEVKQHQSEGDTWTVLQGRVYNISPYLRFHPGGEDMLMKGAGKDCTALFNKYHSWVNAEFLLEKCLVGHLDVEQKKEHGQHISS